MPPTWISVAVTPVVVSPVTGGTTNVGRVAPPVPPETVVGVTGAPAVVAGAAAVVAVVEPDFVLLHPPSTHSPAIAPTMPLLVQATARPPLGAASANRASRHS